MKQVLLPYIDSNAKMHSNKDQITAMHLCVPGIVITILFFLFFFLFFFRFLTFFLCLPVNTTFRNLGQ